MYTINMKITSILLKKIKELQNIDDTVVKGLYTLSTRSFLIIILLGTFVTIALYPFMPTKIMIWYLLLLVLMVYRIYLTYSFYKKPDKFTMKRWYNKFTLYAIFTALLYASLGIYHIHELNHYYQLFIATVLLGLSAGSAFSLSQDLRLSILYIAILLFPLIMTLPFVVDMPLNIILAIILLMYCIAQIIIMYGIHTQRKKMDNLESKHTLFHGLFKNAPLGVFTYNENLDIIDCNSELSRVFMSDVQNIIGMNLNNLPDARPLSIFKKAFEDGFGAYEGSYVSIHGDYFWLEVKAFSFADKINNNLVGIGIIENKTKEHSALQKLEHMVKHDALTGLLNRRGLRNYLGELIKNENHKTHYSILFYLDLNQFKGINDSLGHAIGDKVLLIVARRLETLLDKGCIVSRLGGDEFIIMLPFSSETEKKSNLKAQKYSENIQDIFSEPFIIQDMYLHIHTSIGIVLIKPGEKNTEEILRHADLSMYKAKNIASHISYYDASLDEKQKALFLLQHNLAYATQRNQLELFFQPIVKMKNEELISAELLIRWNHPTKGILSPEEFIPLAIKVGLLSKITWWIVDKACQQIARWKNDGQWKLQYISININATQLIEKDFAKLFFQNLKRYGLETSDILLEITERSLIDNFQNAQSVINDLKNHGVRCAIDDFGTGYSSLSYLKKLSFHTLKIDRTFIKDLGQSPKELILVNTILDIGRLFDYNIIIEGIENEQQKSALLEINDDLSYQGYFYNKAVEAEEFTKKFLA